MTVEDGRPFCPQCHAPQIHVAVAIPESESVGSNSAADIAPDALPPDGPAESRLGSTLPRQPASGNILDRSAAVRAALMAGVLGVFIQVIPFLGIVLTGALAVFFYRRERRMALPAALGARIGGAAGVVAFAINAVLITIRIFVFHARQEYLDFLTRLANSMGGNAADPNFQAGIRSMLTPVGLAFTFLFGMMIAAVLASVGGALASWFLRPRNPRA